MTYDVVALGEVLIDFTMESRDKDGYPTMAAHPGGAPANFLAALAKFGASTALIGKVGQDAFGQMLKHTLETAGVSTTGLVTDPAVFTTLAFVTLDEQGERSFSFARKPGADTRLESEEVSRKVLDQTRVLHFGTLSLTDEPVRKATRDAVAYARWQNKLVTFDPNLREMLWDDLEDARKAMLWGMEQADVVKLSEEELKFLFGGVPQEQGVQRLLEEYGVKLVFLTLGAQGCLSVNRNGSVHVPALGSITPVDTTGAGDIFGGSAVWKLLSMDCAPEELTAGQLEEITRFACAAAGLSTTRPGGISSVPELDEVLRCVSGA